MAATRSSSIEGGSAEAIGSPSNDTTAAASISGVCDSSAWIVRSSRSERDWVSVIRTPSHDGPERPSGAIPSAAVGQLLSAARMASSGAGSPVISSTWRAAWCSSIVAPLTTTAAPEQASAVGQGS